ncbi:apolipoprotein N-acyltransferase [Aminobacter sp. AP02]|uniref:apolipoprotein N-acyltransferase n=1 Tax=Aminobacter sp. AP02 TaxID=2135737 RepID=UPI000D6D328B|nr:apolipoprotein N-acyltransferase [Aminobacter sp. AP02]PWK68335.1 apolipoprotein N-acyltransferase [Aminobacter sp. AP02]
MERHAGQIILLWGWKRALVAFVAGAFAVLGQAPYDFFAACFVSFPILVWLLDGAVADRPAGFLRRLMPAFATGWWFGFGYFLAGLWWVGGALLVEAESFAWALPFAVVGIPLILAFFYGFAAALARLLWSDGIGRIAALAFAFGLTEWLRTFLFTGFPWNPLGFAAMPVPLFMQSVTVVGVTGMNVLAVFVFAMPALLADRRNLKLGLSLAAVLVAAHAAHGFYRLSAPAAPAGRNINVRIVQPNIDLSEKWDGRVRDRIFASMLQLSAEAPKPGANKPDLIIWPETSVPFLFTERPDALVAIGDMLAEGQMLMAGTVREEGQSGAGEEARYYNSVVSINDKGEIVDAVDKVHLVPFGEYIPFAGVMERIGLTQLVAGPMNFTAGTNRQALDLPGGLKASAFICYEIIFPRLVAVDAASTQIMVNVTNDAWFGDTPGPYQHFRQSQIRAVENGLPVLRAANTGISGIVDPSGRVVDALAMNVRGTIDFSLPVAAAGAASAPFSRVNGFLIMFLVAVTATGLKLRQRLRAN